MVHRSGTQNQVSDSVYHAFHRSTRPMLELPSTHKRPDGSPPHNIFISISEEDNVRADALEIRALHYLKIPATSVLATLFSPPSHTLFDIFHFSDVGHEPGYINGRQFHIVGLYVRGY